MWVTQLFLSLEYLQGTVVLLDGQISRNREAWGEEQRLEQLAD